MTRTELCLSELRKAAWWYAQASDRASEGDSGPLEGAVKRLEETAFDYVEAVVQDSNYGLRNAYGSGRR